jgi:hypothetical protein
MIAFTQKGVVPIIWKLTCGFCTGQSGDHERGAVRICDGDRQPSGTYKQAAKS